jgi:hypothetical protein
VTSHILFDVRLSVLHVFIDGDEHGRGSLVRLGNLEEGVVVSGGFLALGAEIEVLANGALVPHAHNRLHLAPIAGHSLMHHRLAIGGPSTHSFGLECLRLRLHLSGKFLLDQFLDHFLRNLSEEFVESLGFNLPKDLSREVIGRNFLFFRLRLGGFFLFVLNLELVFEGKSQHIIGRNFIFGGRLVLGWLSGLGVSRLDVELDATAHEASGDVVSSEEILIVGHIDSVSGIILVGNGEL